MPISQRNKTSLYTYSSGFAISILFGVVTLIISYYNDTYYRGECVITNTTVTTSCHVNICEYTGYVSLEYVKEDLHNEIEMFKLKNETEAMIRMTNKYEIGTSITCYHSNDDDPPIKMSNDRFNSGIIILLVLFFLFALLFLIAILIVCWFIYRDYKSQRNGDNFSF